MKIRFIVLRYFIYIFSAILLLSLVGCPESAGEDNGEDSDSGIVSEFVDSAWGEALGSIAGTVYVDGNPQAYGTVQALDEEGKLIAQERCNQTGHFRIMGLKQGIYRLIYLNARGSPFGGETVVRVRPGRFERVDLELSLVQN
jgi:hypothetical protein